MDPIQKMAADDMRHALQRAQSNPHGARQAIQKVLLLRHAVEAVDALARGNYLSETEAEAQFVYYHQHLFGDNGTAVCPVCRAPFLATRVRYLAPQGAFVYPACAEVHDLPLDG